MPLDQKLHRLPYKEGWAGKRLKEVLREEFPGLSSRNALLAITNGLVKAGDNVLDDADTLLPQGTGIAVDFRHGVHGRGERRVAPLSKRISIIRDDADVVVLSKQPGINVQAVDEEDEEGANEGDPLTELLCHYWRARGVAVVQPILVQRLDRDTSGLMVVAKNPAAAAALQRQFIPPRRLRREYLALVAGVPTTDKFRWCTYLAHGPNGLRQSVGTEKGGEPRGFYLAKLAETHAEVVERRANASLLRLKLETGRTHQIRVHCAESGHPVLGDPIYLRLAEYVFHRLEKEKIAGTPPPSHPNSEAMAQFRRDIREVPLPVRQPKRLALHSTFLSFEHPATGERMEFEDPLPQGLKDFWEQLPEIPTPAPAP